MLREVRGHDAVAELDATLVGRSREPSSVSSSVVLPEPLGPTSATCSPRSSTSEAPSSSSLSPAETTRSSASRTIRPERAGWRNSKPRVRRLRVSDSSSCAAARRSCSRRPIWRQLRLRLLRLRLLVAEPRHEALEPLDVVADAVELRRGRRRARRLLTAPGVPRPVEEERLRAAQLEHGGRDGLEEPPVVRDEDHGGVERGQLTLEPLEVLDVEVVRRLVEEQQVGIGRQRSRERRARQLSTGEPVERAVEVGVPEPEAAQHRCGAVAPRPAARVLEPRLGLAVAAQRRRCVVAARHRLLEPCELLFDRDEVARSRERVLAERQALAARRSLVVERDARVLRERQLAALEGRLADERAEQRRLADAVRPASASRSPRRSRNETPSKRGSPESSLRSPDAIRTAIAPKDRGDRRGRGGRGPPEPACHDPTVTTIAAVAPQSPGGRGSPPRVDRRAVARSESPRAVYVIDGEETDRTSRLSRLRRSSRSSPWSRASRSTGRSRRWPWGLLAAGLGFLVLGDIGLSMSSRRLGQRCVSRGLRLPVAGLVAGARIGAAA